MDTAQMKTSEMIAAVRALAKQVRFADMQGSLLMQKSQDAGQRDDFATMNAFADQAEASWAEMERDFNILIPILTSPACDQVLERLQMAFDAEGE